MKKMMPFLKAKKLGMPVWAWTTILAGAVGVGLVLRARNKPVEGEDESAFTNYGGEDVDVGGFYSQGQGGAYVLPSAGVLPSGVVYSPKAIADELIKALQDYDNDDNTLPTLDEKKGCSTASVPKKRAPKGHAWKCVNNRWTAVKVQGIGGGFGFARDCKGKKPKRTAAMKKNNKVWCCRGGDWVKCQDVHAPREVESVPAGAKETATATKSSVANLTTMGGFTDLVGGLFNDVVPTMSMSGPPDRLAVHFGNQKAQIIDPQLGTIVKTNKDRLMGPPSES